MTVFVNLPVSGISTADWSYKGTDSGEKERSTSGRDKLIYCREQSGILTFQIYLSMDQRPKLPLN